MNQLLTRVRYAERCPCGSSLSYERCCRRWHEGDAARTAPDAQELVRSRYCAYVLGLHGYLLETWHPSTRPGQLEAAPPALRWLGLELRRQREIDANHAEVEFVARSKIGGRAQQLHECCRFVRQDGRWYCVDGELMSPH